MCAGWCNVSMHAHAKVLTCGMCHLRVLPSPVNDLYSAICYCQGLHPDPDLSGDDEEGEKEALLPW